jgi:hypothetical protein
MNSSNMDLDTFSIPIFFNQSDLRTAKRFSMEQSDPTKSRQVYLNTLAICAVQDYLKILGIDTNALNSDSWHQSLRLASNTADLVLPERGVVECVPVSPDDNAIRVSEESQIRRIAYLAVEVTETSQEAKLLGFIRSPGWLKQPIRRTDLSSLDELPTYLSRFHHTSLDAWCQNNISSLWQPPETVLANRYPAFRLRSDATSILKHARVVKLTTVEGSSVNLGLMLSTRVTGNVVDVSIQLHPTPNDAETDTDASPSLPPDISIELLSDEGNSLQKVTSRHHPLDTFIQFTPFRCFAYDYYQIRITTNSDECFEILSFEAIN